VAPDLLAVAFTRFESDESTSTYLHYATGAGSTPVLEGTLPYPSAIAKLGSRLAIGESGFGGAAGRVRIYEADPGTGDSELVATFSGETDSSLGHAVAMDGSILVAGAPREGDCGVVHVYVRLDTTATEGVTWTELQTIDCPSATQVDAEFGAAVAISGALLAVGAPRLDRPNPGGGADFGAVYTFRPVGLLFELETLLRPGEVEADDRFGSSVALHSTPGTPNVALVAGAPGTDGVGGPDVGAAYLYLDWGDRWRESGRFSRLTEGGVSAGTSVAIGGMGILVGAPRYNCNGVVDQGAVFAWNGVVPLFFDGFDRGDLDTWSSVAP
jgi:hypothetical protein